VTGIATTPRPKAGVRAAGWVREGRNPFAGTLELAARAEARGYDGIFVADRLLSQVGQAGRSVYNSSQPEIFTVLAAVAATTTRLQVGTLVVVVPFRHPVVLAKVTASLDALSEGRLILGVGSGWNNAEFSVFGVDKAEAHERLDEALDMLRQLWTGKPVSYAGRFHALTDVVIAPSPARTGGPPVWLGSFAPTQESIWNNRITAGSRNSLERVGRLADTWVPLLYSAGYKRTISAETLGESYRIVQDAAQAANRQVPARFCFSHWYFAIDNADDTRELEQSLSSFFPGTLAEARETYLIGSPEQIAQRIAALCRYLPEPEWYILTQLGSSGRQLDLLESEILPRLGVALTPR
jgi:probable F420-dependent oxidoreductase